MIDRLSGLYEDSSRFLFFPFSLDVVLFFFGGKDVMVVCPQVECRGSVLLLVDPTSGEFD